LRAAHRPQCKEDACCDRLPWRTHDGAQGATCYFPVLPQDYGDRVEAALALRICRRDIMELRKLPG
jgi:hypothetical protein